MISKSLSATAPIFLQRGLACGDHANHSHARQQGQDHCPMPDRTDGLRKESG